MRPSGRRGRTAGRVCGSLAEIRMPPVAEVFAATDAVGSGKVCQVVAPFVEAYVTMMSSPVFAPVGKVMMRTGKIEMIVVGIDHADPQDPPSGVHVDGTEKYSVCMKRLYCLLLSTQRKSSFRMSRYM